jgi:hypothetical protein
MGPSVLAQVCTLENFGVCDMRIYAAIDEIPHLGVRDAKQQTSLRLLKPRQSETLKTGMSIQLY